MENKIIEEIYVQEVYEKLAHHEAFRNNQNNILNNTEDKSNLQKLWPNVRAFLKKLPLGSILIDAGS